MFRYRVWLPLQRFLVTVSGTHEVAGNSSNIGLRYTNHCGAISLLELSPARPSEGKYARTFHEILRLSSSPVRSDCSGSRRSNQPDCRHCPLGCSGRRCHNNAERNRFRDCRGVSRLAGLSQESPGTTAITTNVGVKFRRRLGVSLACTVGVVLSSVWRAAKCRRMDPSEVA